MFSQVSTVMCDPCFWFSSPSVQPSGFVAVVNVASIRISAVVINSFFCIFFRVKYHYIISQYINVIYCGLEILVCG